MQLSRETLVKDAFFAALVVVASSERIVMKMIVDRLRHYTFFFAELLTIFYVFIFFGIVVFKRSRTKDITEDMMAYPKSKFLAMAAFDTVASLLTFIPAAFISGDLMVLLLQAVIPVSLAASVLYLNKRFFVTHYAGALVVIVGIAMDIIPRLVKEDSWVEKIGVWRVIAYSGLLLLSTVPQAAGSIYKEVAMKQEMDPYFLNAWVALFQAGLSLLVCPIAFKMQSPELSLEDMPRNFHDGFMCFFAGKNFQPDDHCNGAWGLMLLYICINIAFNVVMTYLFMHGSAVLVWIGMATAVPISYLFFSIKAIQDPPAELSVWGILALIVTVTGIVVYNKTQEPETTYGPIATDDENAPLIN